MNIFRKPYPKGTNTNRKLIFAFAFGLFVFLFLTLFQPFGLNTWQTDHKILKLGGYGVVTALVILFNAFVLEGLFRDWYAEKNWTVGKEIISAVWNILFIGSLNLLYTRLLGVARVDFTSFLAFQWITLMVGIIPVTMVTLLNYTRLLKLNTKGALELNAIIGAEHLPNPSNTSMELEFLAENEKDKLMVRVDDLLAVGAADNYIEVYYILRGEMKKELIRSTLKKAEMTIHKFPQLMRCHRSYIVNLNHVEKVSGNSQGLKLHLKNTELLIPVSRTLNEIIKQRMKERHSVRPV